MFRFGGHLVPLKETEPSLVTAGIYFSDSAHIYVIGCALVKGEKSREYFDSRL